MAPAGTAKYFLGAAILTAVLILSANASEVKSGVEEVEELLSLGDGIDNHGASEYIILMGSSGVGKSTLAKFLIKDPSMTVTRKGSRTFLYTDNDETISTVTKKSKTLLPNYYRDNETGQVIVDLPGFSDTRDRKHEIAASYFIKSVLESAKKLKLVLVENAFSLTEGHDRYGLTRLVRHVAGLIPDLTEFGGSVGLIATKASYNGLSDEENTDEILEYLKTFALDEDNTNSTNEELIDPDAEGFSELKVMESLIGLSEGNNIGLFYKPNKEGNPWESYLVNKCWDSLRKLIFAELPCKTVPENIKFKYSLSVEGQVFVKENLINTTNDRVYTEMQQILHTYTNKLKEELTTGNKSISQMTYIATTNNKEFQYLASNLPDLGKIVKRLGNLQLFKGHELNNLTFLVRKAEFFHGVIERSTSSVVADIRTILKPFQKILQDTAVFFEFLSELIIELNSYWPQYNRKALSKPLTISNFRKIILNAEKYGLKISDKDTLYAVSLQIGMIDDLNKVLKHYLDYTVSFAHNDSELIIKGQNILISEIKRKLPTKAMGRIQNIYIYAHKKIFIDDTLTVEKANLFFAAPAIEGIVKKPGATPKIQTIGVDSTDVMWQSSKCEVPGKNGKTGEPGKVGGKAGNILIAALEFTAPTNVEIGSKGGRGGKGQNGGEGCDGKTSPTPKYTDGTYYKTVDAVIHQYQSLGYIVRWSHGAVQISNDQQNSNPTEGGVGGEGGPGGNPGSIIIKIKKTNDGLISQKLSFGESGPGGDGGKGGKGMPSCTQVHLFCERRESLQKTRKFNIPRFTCQWFRSGCDIIVNHVCKFVTMKFCTEMTPDANLGEHGEWSSLAENRALPKQDIVDVSRVKVEVARLVKKIRSPGMIELNSFVDDAL